MGYFTTYKLTIEGVDQKVVSDILSHTIPESEESDSSTLAEIFEISSDEEILGNTFTINTKWYEHEVDLVLLSEVYPTALFRLIGWGEDVADYWVAYYQNGKTYRNTPEIESFDPAALAKPDPYFLHRGTRPSNGTYSFNLTIEGIDQEVVSDILSHTIPESEESDSNTLAKIFEISPNEEILGNTFTIITQWYEHDVDLVLLSKVYPTALFRLAGWGEDVADYWVAYYQNGKTYRNTPEIESFDPAALAKPDLRFWHQAKSGRYTSFFEFLGCGFLLICLLMVLLRVVFFFMK
jgi:hypothetical protein